MPTYRANPTDKQQNEIEGKNNSAGIPVLMNSTTRVVAKGFQTSPERVASSSSGVPQSGDSAGVIMPADDTPGRFVSDQQGRRI